MKTTLFTVIASLMICSPALCEVKNESAMSKKDVENIENVVRDLIKREPQIIEKALNASLEAAKAAEEKEGSKLVAKERQAIFEDKNDPILGNPNGSVAIAVFMDPYCGYCRKFQAVLLSLAKERKDLKIIYKAFPILGAESVKAAEEELAANIIGRFADYHEAIYESAVRSRKERLELAASNHIDVTKLTDNTPGLGKEPGAAQVEKQLRENIKLGKRLGLNGTPAFVLGDQLVKGYVEKEALNAMIQNLKK